MSFASFVAPKCTICTIISKHITAGCHRRWGLLLGRLKLCIFFFRLLVHHKHTTVPVKFRNLSTSLLRATSDSLLHFAFRLPLTFCAQSTSAGLNFSRPASFKNFFCCFCTHCFQLGHFFYCSFLNSLQTMLGTVMVGSGNLHQPFFSCFFLYFVRFFCGR